MLGQVWKTFLIAALIVMCVSLALICNQLAYADHAKEFQAQQVQIEELRRQLADERTRQAERRHDVDPPSEQSLKDLAQGFAGLIAGPTPSASPSNR